MKPDSSENLGLLPTKAILQLFERMTYIYAHKWTSVMGESTTENGELSVAAKTWQAGLSGISPQQLGKGLEKVLLSGNAWYPTLPEFRLLCSGRADCPSVEQVVSILANSAPRQGSIATRYQHPLAFAVAQDKCFDSFAFKTATTQNCIAIVKPIYTKLVQVGWLEFLPAHFEEFCAIEAPKKRTIGFGLSALAELKAAL